MNKQLSCLGQIRKEMKMGNQKTKIRSSSKMEELKNPVLLRILQVLAFVVTTALVITLIIYYQYIYAIILMTLLLVIVFRNSIRIRLPGNTSVSIEPDHGSNNERGLKK